MINYFRERKHWLFRNLANLGGWQSVHKIVVFESDDWGSVRMPSSSAYNKLENAGLDLWTADADRYNKNDSLATSLDLTYLFEVLASVKDKNDRWAVFTPITITANPDFKKIRESHFTEYYYELFTDTLKKYPGCERSFDLWREGIRNNLFVPQMHGREHLNVHAWMRALKEREPETMVAFKNEMWGFVPKFYPSVDYQAALLFDSVEELESQKKIITDGLEKFRVIFGYDAEYFVPPNGIINNSLNRVLFEGKIRFRYAPIIQHEPVKSDKFRIRVHWLGQRDTHGIVYLIRNAFFEPSLPGRDWVDSCLRDIKIAFRWGKPAIISTHRVNYIGTLNPSNRESGLKQLRILLRAIVKNWPDVTFMTSPELGKIINGRKYS